MTTHKTVFIVAVFTLVMAPTYVDFAMTQHALATGRYYEANPVARLYVSQPLLSVPILTVGQYGVTWGLSSLFDDSPAVAWALVAVFVVLRVLVLSHNARVLR
jgi:hypothetical protein